MAVRKTDKSIWSRFIMTFVLIFALSGVCGYFFSDLDKDADTPIIIYTREYSESDEHTVPEDSGFNEGSPEYMYLKGLEQYLEGNVIKAKEIFSGAARVLDKHTDAALPTYLYCYLNECEIETTGEGSVEFAKRALEEAALCSAAANDHATIWNTGSSIAVDEETDALVIGLLQNIIDKVPNLDLEARVRYENCIATLDFVDGNYGKSIRRFYDVRSLTKDIVNPSQELIRQMGYTDSYIAGFYFEFGDYERAVELYNENLAKEIEDPYLNARIKSADYINLSASYLELEDYENAKRVCRELEKVIPNLDEDIQADYRASMYDALAQCAFKEGDYEACRYYTDKSEEQISLVEEDAFYGTEAFIRLSRDELSDVMGDSESARLDLEDMLESGDAAFAGIEKEVYELLIKIYGDRGDLESVIKYQNLLMEYSENFHRTMQQGYMDFSRDYEDARYLEQINSALEQVNSFSAIVTVLVIVLLLGAVFIILNSRKSSRKDHLTGALNRLALHDMEKKFQKSGVPNGYCCIMADIDYFKNYNDTYGHLEGDEVLRNVTQVLKESIRDEDILVRYGGEEFLIIIRDFGDRDPRNLGDRILENMRERAIPHKASEIGPIVTISMGFYINMTEGQGLSEVLQKADEALYKAKEEGRNRLCIYRED